MPVYSYRAATKSGKVVSGKIDDVSRQKVTERLESNNLTPISVDEQRGPQFLKMLMPAKRTKKNQVSSAAVTKLAREKLIAEQQKKQQNKGLNKEISIDLSFMQRVKKEDVIAFTQSLFLLKRANFTNTRALTTLLENTENPQMKSIIED